MAGARAGDTVRVHYTGRLEDGTVFESSQDREPLSFTLGEGEVLPGLEDAVEGMSPGERKTAWLPSDRAYGPHRDDLVLLVDRGRFPPHIQPQVGQHLSMRRQGEDPVIVAVTGVSDGEVVLDANHPLAGREVTFDLELLEIT